MNSFIQFDEQGHREMIKGGGEEGTGTGRRDRQERVEWEERNEKGRKTGKDRREENRERGGKKRLRGQRTTVKGRDRM